MSLCPCGSTLNYALCCGQYLDNRRLPETPEQLMRSRYTAYTQAQIPYIKATMRDKALQNFNEAAAHDWAKSVTWLKLEVLQTYLENPQLGFVEFSAYFLERDQVKHIRELSEFHKIDQQWFYVEGKHREAPSKKIGRNTPCPCSSGKKFKNCHGT